VNDWQWAKKKNWRNWLPWKKWRYYWWISRITIKIWIWSLFNKLTIKFEKKLQKPKLYFWGFFVDFYKPSSTALTVTEYNQLSSISGCIGAASEKSSWYVDVVNCRCHCSSPPLPSQLLLLLLLNNRHRVMSRPHHRCWISQVTNSSATCGDKQTDGSIIITTNTHPAGRNAIRPFNIAAACWNLKLKMRGKAKALCVALPATSTVNLCRNSCTGPIDHIFSDWGRSVWHSFFGNCEYWHIESLHWHSTTD